MLFFEIQHFWNNFFGLRVSIGIGLKYRAVCLRLRKKHNVRVVRVLLYVA